MIDCGQALSSLHPFLAGEIGASVRAEITNHLHACPDCSQAYDFHRELKGVIALKAQEHSMPQAFWQRLQNRMEHELGDEFVEIREVFTRAVDNVKGGLLHGNSAFPKPVFGATPRFEPTGAFDPASPFDNRPFDQPSPFDRPSPFEP